MHFEDAINGLFYAGHNAQILYSIIPLEAMCCHQMHIKMCMKHLNTHRMTRCHYNVLYINTNVSMNECIEMHTSLNYVKIENRNAYPCCRPLMKRIQKCIGELQQVFVCWDCCVCVEKTWTEAEFPLIFWWIAKGIWNEHSTGEQSISICGFTRILFTIFKNISSVYRHTLIS